MIDYESYCHELDRRRTTKNDSTIIQCSECDNSQELTDQITDQAAIKDGWLLEPVVYRPVHGPDEQ